MSTDSHVFGEIQVRHVMVRDPITVRADAALLHVMRPMTQRRIGAVLVGEDGRLDGIFTERDLLRYAADAPDDWRERPVGAWMTRKLHTISADAGWEDAVALMERAHVRHV